VNLFMALFHSMEPHFHMSVCPSFATLMHVTVATLSTLLLSCVSLILRNFMIIASSLPRLHHNDIPLFCLGCALPRHKMNSDQDSPLESASSISPTKRPAPEPPSAET
jgi:hypothetical protein